MMKSTESQVPHNSIPRNYSMEHPAHLSQLITKILKYCKSEKMDSSIAGDYRVRLSMEESGEREVQKSAILTNRDNGNVAGLSTQLKDITSFYDNNCNNVLESPKNITLRGNGTKSDVTVSSDMTLQELTNAIESKITSSTESGGLGLTGATFACDTTKNQIIFTIHDTNAQHNSQSPANITSGVTLALTANRTFTLNSIVNYINGAIAVSNDDNHALTPPGYPTSSNYQIPGIRARADGYNIVFESTATGSSSSISILADQASTDILGIRTSRMSGTGGESASILGSTDISNGVTFAGTGVIEIQIADGDHRVLFGPADSEPETAGLVTFNAGTAISATSIISTFNNAFTSNNLQMQASLTSDGRLQISTTETGTDARVSINAIAGSIAALGMISGQVDRGEGGTAAVYNGATAASNSTIGFLFNRITGFNVTDKVGATSGTIYIGNNGSLGPGGVSRSHAVSREQITSVFNASNIGSTDVNYRFDAGNRLDLFSRSSGEDSRIVLSTTNTNMISSAVNGLGIDISSSTQGDGKTEFNIHIADRKLAFQIGANKSQQLDFGIINTSAKALNIHDLDVTNIRSATTALGKIDNAVNAISSERSKLGSLQNRLTSTVNNLTVTATNLQSTESKIRDVDIAVETVAFTGNQILIQAGTAQLSQARGLTQGALQLLE